MNHSTDSAMPARFGFLGCLTVGLGTAVAMWAVGYLTHLPGLRTPLALTAGLFTATQLAGGIVAGRALRPAAVSGAVAGLISSLVNLLIVGSVISSPDQPDAVRENWWVMFGATLAFGPIISAVGAAMGSRTRPFAPASPQRWLARLAMVAAVSALPVLLSGGIVTSAEAGKAVPDYPGTYGYPMFLFPLQHMTGGIYYEHAHRLFGALVGLCTLILTIAVFVRERRAWVKGAALIALLLVIAQGLAGGFGRVEGAHVPSADIAEVTSTQVPLDLNKDVDTKAGVVWAIAHGITGQLTFAYLCVLAAFLAPAWIDASSRKRPDSVARTFALAALIAYLLQLFLGAGLRHTQLAAFQHPHIAMSILVLILSLMAGTRVRVRHADIRALRFFGTLMAHGVGAQFLLGLAALFVVLPHKDDPTHIPSLLIATAHQFLGALLIGSAGVVFAWTRRVIAKGAAPRPAEAE